MSFWGKKIRFNVNGIGTLDAEAGRNSAKVVNFANVKNLSKEASAGKIKLLHGVLYLIGVIAASSAVIFSFVFFMPAFGENDLQAIMVLPKPANAVTDFLAGSFTDVKNVNFKLEGPSKSFVNPGATNVEVVKIKIYSAKDALVLESIDLKVSEDFDGKVSNFKLGDGGDGVYNGVYNDGYVQFRGLHLGVEPGVETYFNVYADFSETLHPGQRIYFEIADPADIELTSHGQQIHVEKDYPVVSPGMSVIGKHMFFGPSI